MTDGKSEKVYLLPQTIEHYRKELTRLLEFERYEEAVKLLEFLIDCDTQDQEVRQEWSALLDYLVMMFPELRLGEHQEEEDLLQTEEDLFKLHLAERTAADPAYADSLLELFRQAGYWDKQVLALEQLLYVEHPDVRAVLSDWLRREPSPPSLQFRTLQILKARGETGTVWMNRLGRTYSVELRDVPLGPDEYPLPYQEVLNRVLQSASFGSGLPLEEFANQIWAEYVAYTFGTPLYLELLSAPSQEWDAWSAALHLLLARTVQGAGQTEEHEIRESYGITEELEPPMEAAGRILQDFADDVFPALA